MNLSSVSSFRSATRRRRSGAPRGADATLTAWGRPYEIIVVDDGSTDDSFQILARLQAADPRLRVIRFRRNFGQTAAFAAGFDHARGRIIVTSDGDLQNDPRDIPGARRRRSSAGHDIVCGWRKDRKDAFLSRRLPSMIANWVISIATGVHLHDYGCSLKAFRAEVVKPLKLYGEMHRFLPAIASEQGVSIAERVVNHRPRRHGRVEVRHLAHDPRDPGSDDGEVSAELFDAAAADFRADRLRDGAARRRR